MQDFKPLLTCISSVSSCFNVLQRNMHSCRGMNSAFYRALPAGQEQTPGVILAFVILTQFKRSPISLSLCVERRAIMLHAVHTLLLCLFIVLNHERFQLLRLANMARQDHSVTVVFLPSISQLHDPFFLISSVKSEICPNDSAGKELNYIIPICKYLLMRLLIFFGNPHMYFLYRWLR